MAYKVVIDYGKRGLRSAALSIDLRCSTEYKPGNPTKGEAGPAFVFKFLQDAIDASRSIADNQPQIWRCKTKNLRRQAFMLDYPNPFTEVVKFWKVYNDCALRGDEEAEFTYIVSTIKGTYVADEVTLTKRVR